MALLFHVSGKIVAPTVEVLLISPFKEIWERDESTVKELAILEFSYMEFMTSQKKTNPFKGYSEGKRRSKLLNDVMPKNWVADDLIKQGITKIMEFQNEASITLSFFESAKNAADKLKDFFDTFDMNAINPKTLAPLYKPKEISSAINDSAATIRTLATLRQKVEEEIYEEVKVRGKKEIGIFADPNSVPQRRRN